MWAGGSIGDTIIQQRRALTPGDLAGGVTTYFGPDSSHNIRLMFGETGIITDRAIWQAFGELFARTGSAVSPFGFGGQ